MAHNMCQNVFHMLENSREERFFRCSPIILGCALGIPGSPDRSLQAKQVFKTIDDVRYIVVNVPERRAWVRPPDKNWTAAYATE